MSIRGRDMVCEILNVNLDDLGPYAKVRVSLPDGTVVIRWGLDKLTFDNLQRAVAAQLDPMRVGTCYVLLLTNQTLSNPETHSYQGQIDCKLGNQWIRINFGCSDLFLANLSWLFGVTSVEELASLEWGRWTEAYPHLFSPDETLGRLAESTGGLGIDALADSRRRPWLRRRVMFVMVAVLAFALLLGLDAFVQGQRARHMVSFGPLVTSPKVLSPTVKAQESNRPTNVPPSPSVRPSQPVIYQVPAGQVALTFDDSPTPYTEGILSTLQKYHVQATFFIVGKNALQFPKVVSDVVRAGHEIGDHSADLKDMKAMTSAEQTAEVQSGRRDIQQEAPVHIDLFRPPYELFNSTTEKVVSENHMTLALWNRDPKDWQATSPADVVHRVLALPASGGVFVLHDTKYTMLALPTILQHMTNEHLRFVVLQPDA